MLAIVFAVLLGLVLVALAVRWFLPEEGGTPHAETAPAELADTSGGRLLRCFNPVPATAG